MTSPTPTHRNRMMIISYRIYHGPGARSNYNHAVRGMRAARTQAAAASARPGASSATITDHAGTVRAIYSEGRIDRTPRPESD